MRTKAGLVIAAIAMIAASCQNASFKKSKSGLVYKIFPGKDTVKVNTGDIIKFNVVQKINDSTVYPPSANEATPQYVRVEGEGRPYDPSELYTMLKQGDSLVTVQMMDSFIKKNPAMPPQFKNGDRITTTFKILNVFKSVEDAQKDQAKEQEKSNAKLEGVKLQSQKDFEEYIVKNKITGTKTPGGVYVDIIKPGEGVAIDSGMKVSVMYKGTTLKGKVFDTNMDNSKGHTEPLDFIVGPNSPRPMIAGFDEAIRLFKKGGKGRFYVPAELGYGPQSRGEDIHPYENMIFDIEVVDVQDKPTAGPKMPQVKIDTAQPKK